MQCQKPLNHGPAMPEDDPQSETEANSNPLSGGAGCVQRTGQALLQGGIVAAQEHAVHVPRRAPGLRGRTVEHVESNGLEARLKNSWTKSQTLRGTMPLHRDSVELFASIL